MSNLLRKMLGSTGLQVTQLGYGAMEIRGSRIWTESIKTGLNNRLKAE